MTKLNRRSVIGAAMGAIPMVVASRALARGQAKPDLVVALSERLQAAILRCDAAWAARDKIEGQIGREALDMSAHDLDPETAKRLKFDRWFCAVNSRRGVSLDSVMELNRQQEQMTRTIDDFAENAELQAEYAQQRADGRARVRWWISESRRKQGLQKACGWTAANETAGTARDELNNLEDELIRTRATSLQGIYAKLEVLERYTGCEGLTIDEEKIRELDWESAILNYAARDVRMLMASA